MSTEEELEQNLTMAMHDAHYGANIDPYGDSGAGYNHTKMYQTFMASEPFKAWLAERERSLRERVEAMGQANKRKNRILIAIRNFVEDWPDDPFGRKRDQVLAIMAEFKGR